ncbi:MAG TPA: amidohydrolase [Thermoanaerobaculia bacterium]|nr:amidohydrolase [Thermoanaerobaculia bacterium]
MLRKIAAVLLTTATATIAAGAASASQDAADLVLRHGTLYPVSAAGAVEGSLAVRGARIVYLGPDAGVQPFVGPKTEVVELHGRAVTPGLIDAHSHLEGLGAALAQVDLSGIDSYEEVVRRVAAAAAKAPAGAWVRGRGWDQNRWPDKSFPVHGPLSAAVPDHPVWLERVDGHAALLNAAGMRAVRLTAADPDPTGGRILRDASGAPTGVLVDNAEGVYEERVPPPSVAERRARLVAAGRACAALGLTTVTDMGIGAESAAAYRDLQQHAELPVRVAAFWSGSDSHLPEWLAGGPWRSDDAFLTLRGVKLYADGALGSRGAALIEAYADDPGNFGLVVTPGAELERVARLARDKGYQVAIHAIGDRGNLIALDALDAALGGEPHPELRWRIEHVQIVRRQDLERMGKLGIIASMQPTHATSDMPWAPDRLGASRLDRAYPWRTAINSGAHLALGSDFPVERPDPRLGLYAAVTRQDLDGKPPGGWLPDQRLTREEALRGFTRDAAWSLFLDDQVGTLETGKRADLVVWEHDPMTIEAREIPRAGVDLTVVDGRVVYRREGAS